jgi:glucans biosynthesis protein C
MRANPVPEGRLFFLDWLRILAFFGLIFYHVGMYYVSWGFHVKSPFAGPGLEPWMRLSEPWRMSLLFMVSGAATFHMLKRGPSLVLIRRRSAYLLMPLLLGAILIVPPQSYFEVVQRFNYRGSYLDFLGLYFSGYAGFCVDGRCLILPTWNHLWFLPYLWAYTLLACGLLAVWPAVLGATQEYFDKTLDGVWLLAIPMTVIFVFRLTLFERFPVTHDLIGDWFSHAIYLSMFACGAVLAGSKRAWERMASARWLALALALTFWATLVFIRPAKPVSHAVIAVYQWSALIAAFGFAFKHLNRDWPLRQQLTEAVFPVYLLHQTVMIIATQWLLPLHWKPALEGPVLIIVTIVLSYSGYRFVSRFDRLRPWFGMKPRGLERRAPRLLGR